MLYYGSYIRWTLSHANDILSRNTEMLIAFLISIPTFYLFFFVHLMIGVQSFRKKVVYKNIEHFIRAPIISIWMRRKVIIVPCFIRLLARWWTHFIRTGSQCSLQKDGQISNNCSGHLYRKRIVKSALIHRVLNSENTERIKCRPTENKPPAVRCNFSSSSLKSRAKLFFLKVIRYYV